LARENGGPFEMNAIKEIFAYREMRLSLVRKDLRGRYKGSVLGFLWTFINPLLQLAVYTLVFSAILLQDIEQYYLFLFVALIPWIFFASCLSTGSACVIGEKSLITKIYFPREVIPISYVTSCFVNMLYCFVVVLAVVWASGRPVNIAAWMYLPVIMLIEYIMALGIAMLTSSITVYFRDLQHILGIVAMAWQFLTPILYPITLVPDSMMGLFMLNPMTPVITAYRDILYFGQIPHLYTLTHAFVFGVAILVVGYVVFGALKKKFAEEL
jgi:ABC-2 type transport system permease protein